MRRLLQVSQRTLLQTKIISTSVRRGLSNFFARLFSRFFKVESSSKEVKLWDFLVRASKSVKTFYLISAPRKSRSLKVPSSTNSVPRTYPSVPFHGTFDLRLFRLFVYPKRETSIPQIDRKLNGVYQK